MKSIMILEKISKISLYLLVFLVPLWFLPFTQDVLAYQKQTLLLVLVFLAIVSWLAKSLGQGALTLRKSWLYLPVGLLLILVGGSVIFSLWSYGSFWGWPLDVTDSFLTIFAFSLFYFLMVNVIENPEQLFRLFFLLVISGVLVGIITLLNLYQVFIFPFDFAKIATFNTVGTTNSLAVFAAILLPLAFVLAFVSRFLLRTFLWILVLILFSVLVLINFFDAWVALIGGLAVALTFGMLNLRKRAEFGWVSFPMVLIVVAIFFIVFRFSLPGAPAIPLEVSPSTGAEFDILKNVIKEKPFLGSGPGTFIFDYAQFHSALLNQTIFWGTRFASGASEILDWLATKGILGLAALLGLIGTAFFFGVRNLTKPSGKKDKAAISGQDTSWWMMSLGSLTSFSALVIAQFLYPSNFTLWFLFWVLLGGLTVLTGQELKKISITPPSSLALLASFLFLLVLIFGLGLLFISGQKYAAEVQYLLGVRASAQGDLDRAITKILSAARLNPSVDLYWRDLSQLYLARINQIGTRTDLSAEEKQQQIQVAVANAVASAQQVTALAPANVANWNVSGFVYRNLIGVPGAENFAMASYEKATELEPASPFSWTELGRVYVLQAQNLAQKEKKEREKDEALNKALEKLQKARELKEDYAPAHYLIALVYDQQGKSEEAISKLEETKLIAPNDIGLAFQLGVIYWQKEKIEKAQAELERAKTLDPNYSNARYMLGLVYDKQGKKEKAKAEFQAVAELNPDNEEIKKILANLAAGKAALEGITPGRPPIQETPPEITQEGEKEKK